MEEIIKFVVAVAFLCCAVIGSIVVMEYLFGYVTCYVNCSSTEVDQAPAIELTENEIKPSILTLEFINCLVLHDLVSFTDLLNTSKNICTVYIGRDNAVLFDGIDSTADYKVCEIRSKADWQSSSLQFDGPGCFVQEGTFDINSTNLEILNVFVIGYGEWL